MNKLVEMLGKVIKKRSVKNGVWLYMLQFFNTIVPLLTLPYITRILGANGYGVFSIALNIIGYLQVIVEYGFAMSATREVAVGKNLNLNRLFSEVVYSRLVLMVMSVFIAGIYMLAVGNLQSNFCLCLLLFCLPGYCLQMNWLYQGKEEMKYISIVNIVSRSLTVIGTFAFVKNESDLFLYCILYAASPLLSGIIGFVIARQKYKLHFIRLDFNGIFNSLKKGWYVFTTQLGAKVFGAIGVTVLGVFVLPKEVGIYSAIQKIPNILLLAWLPISQVIYPISSKKMRDGYTEGATFVKKMKQLFLPLFGIIAACVAIFARPIVRISFGNEYVDHYYLLFPLLGWMIVSIHNNFLGVQTLLASGHDRDYSKCFYIGVLTTIVSNLLFIWTMGVTGAALAPLVSETVLGIALWSSKKKIEGIVT